jgi:class 3 adenylate cyclase
MVTTASDDDLELRLLGPLQVLRGGAPVDLGKGRDRDVLLRLVLSANQVVPAERLVDDLWGESPPPSVAHALQVHVSNLRKRLEPNRPKGTDGRLIQTHKPGYLLRLAPDQLDVTRFEQLAAAGRTAARSGRHDEAASQLRDALAIWRGPALAEVAYEPWAEAEAARLEESRVAVLEDRFDADLAVGRHAEIVGEVEAVARQHPWRERVWGQYLLALYRSGRQAEALRAADQLRRALRDELGLDPSAEIRALEHAILDQDARLAQPAVEAEPAAAVATVVAAPEPVEPVDPGGRDEQKVVTTLFADLTGSTPLGEALEPEEFKAVVGEVVSRMIAAVTRYGGTVVNVAGDGILALFGAPVAHEDDAERAVRAGLELVGEVATYGVEVAEAWEVEAPAAHVGIHTGLVVLGPMGDGEVELTAMGDVVNTAARIEGQAAPGTVLVSTATRRSVEPLFTFGPVREVTLKGKRDAVEVSEVTAVQATRGKVRGVAGLDVDLVGRQRELGAGRRAVDAVVAGSGGILLVTGDAGVGKSRHLGELAGAFDECTAAADRPGRWLTGRSLSYGERLGYWPVRDLLRDWLGVTGQEPELRIKVRLRGRLDALFGDDDPVPQRQVFLGNLLGLHLDAEAAEHVRSLGPNELRAATVESVTTLVRRLADDGPVVVAFDDLHWADGDSIALVGELLELADSAAVLVVVAQRLERSHPSWAVHEQALRQHAHRSTEIALGPLAAGHDAELLDALVGPTTLPPGLRRSLLDAAEGNPFFLEELVRSMIASGALVRDEPDGSWRLDGEVTIEVPETVEKVIQSRIDGLSTAARDVLGASAVLGRQFDLELLGAVVDDPAGLDDALAELQRREMLSEVQRWPRAEHRFKHALIQETAYRNLVPSRRQQLHRQAALVLESRGDDETGRDGLLAHHFEQAGDAAAARRAYRRAAEEARRIHAVQAALAHYDAALRLVDEHDHAMVAELAFGRGQLLRQLARHADARPDLYRALAAARELGDAQIEFTVLAELGMMELQGGTAEGVQARFEDGLTAAEAAGDPAGQAALLGRLAIESIRRLRFDQAQAQADRAVDLARRSGDRRATARALDGLKRVTLTIGDLARFEEVVGELEGLLRADDDRWYLQHALAEHAVVAAALGRWTEAFARSDEAIELNRLTGNRVDEPIMWSLRSQIERSRGRYGDALAHASAATSIAREFDHLVWGVWAGVTTAALQLDLEAPDAALGALDSVLAAGRHSLSDDQLLRAHAFAALAHHDLGDRDAAEAALAAADELRAGTTCPPGGHAVYLFDAEVAVGRVRLAVGDAEVARRDLAVVRDAGAASGWHEATAAAALALAELGGDADAAHAVDASVAGGLPGLEWRARAVASGLHRRAGRSSDAVDEATRAAEVVDQLADSLPDADARSAFRNRARRRRATLAGA